MISDTLVFAVRASVSRYVLDRMPRVPSWRMANLHIAALERDLKKFRKKFWVIEAASVLGGEASKTQKKEMVKALGKLNQKAGKLKSSLAKTLEEAYVHDKPEVTPRAARRAMVLVTRMFDKVVVGAVKDRQKALEGLSGLTQPGKKLKS